MRTVDVGQDRSLTETTRAKRLAGRPAESSLLAGGGNGEATTLDPSGELGALPAQSELQACPQRVRRHAVSFVLPAYNEQANITTAIESTVGVAERYCSDFEVIVVDDGSSDRTAQLVALAATRHPEVRLISHGINRGYGEALRTGFAGAGLDFVFFTDADNQFDVNELPLLLAWADHADVVAGYRKVRHDPAVRRLNAWAWNRLMRVLFYIPVRDIDCAFKLFRRRVLAEVEIDSRGAMINTEIMVKLARAGRTVVEVGVTHLPRTAGSPQGAKLNVILRAFREVITMYPRLGKLGPGSAPTVIDLRTIDGSEPGQEGSQRVTAMVGTKPLRQPVATAR